MRILWKIIRELIYPDLKSNKHYEYTDDHECNCTTCAKKKKRGMYSRDNSDFFCVECYIRDKGNDLKVTFNKRKLALIIAGLVLLFVAQSILIIYLAIPQTEIDNTSRNAIVDFFYPWTDKTVSKDIIEIQVDTIISRSKYPELALSIWFHESRGNPGAVSKTGARGSFQIINGWVEKLKKDGIIIDARDLHDPIKGVIAGNAILGYHLVKANGDMMGALRDYVGDKTTAGESEYVRNVLATYGNIKLLEMAVKERKVGKDMGKWWVGKKEKPLKPTNKSKK